MGSDQDIGKKMMEEMELASFLDSYERATGETIPELQASETPDFLGTDEHGQTVGIELVRLQFEPDHMFWRRIIERQEWVDHNDAFIRIVDLIARKAAKLSKGGWPTCERKILVIQLFHCPLSELLPNLITERPDSRDFTEIWLADHTIMDIYGGVDLFPIIHPYADGHFPVASADRKPYG